MSKTKKAQNTCSYTCLASLHPHHPTKEHHPTHIFPYIHLAQVVVVSPTLPPKLST